MISILFGAGASLGSAECIPMVPPDGKKLFHELVKLNGAFYYLSDDVKKIFYDQGFEAGMAAVPNVSYIIIPLQKELAIYLGGFSIAEGNAYSLLFKKIKHQIRGMAVSTLNYDLLIEQALDYNNINYSYEGLGRDVDLMKLHGSSNFLTKLPNNWVMKNVTMGECDTFIDTGYYYTVNHHREIVRWCRDPRNEILSPVMANYEKGKRVVTSSRFVEKIQTRYQKKIEESDLVILIGVRYIKEDAHIWECIEKSKCKVIVVDPFPAEIKDWLLLTKKNKHKIIQKGFLESIDEIQRHIKSRRIF